MSLTYSYDTPNTGEATVDNGPGSGYSGTITIPDTVENGGTTYNVTAIKSNAFRNYSNITGITIGNNVTSIGTSAIYYCSALTTLTIGNSVQTIGDYAFEGCSDMQSLTIPDSVTSIGKYAFAFWSKLSSVTIGNSVQTIGERAFRPCSALQSVIIPDSVQTIGTYAFSSSLKSVTIGNGVTSIGQYAFRWCDELNFVYFKHNATQAASINFASDVFLSINDNSNTVDLVLDSSQNSVTLDGTTYTVGDTGVTLSGGTFANVISSTNICFPAGTVLSLDQGDVEIQNVDTKKHTLNGKPILFVTKTAPNKPDVVCFEKDAFAPNVPSQRFECSRAHGIEYNGVRKMAEDWVDADQIHFVPNTHKFLYCLLLETHEMMDVYNIKAETLNPVRKVAQMYFAQLRKEKESC